MKHIMTMLLAFLLVSACSIPKNPKVSFGKKCMVKDESVSYSYVWLYDKELGLTANKEDCQYIEEKD